ncbi:hypothetical protein [Jiella marina]|uniref:hypothetical protein n=1 Tax=Jiella sp. LLJ827 TaxID=2917712 RepID=UPI0021018278|nr:hypothetical protein [Jiella sp. LLJ827]MCQ0988171.1 hypothetical protein [Jiella sp. LLJ827]
MYQAIDKAAERLETILAIEIDALRGKSSESLSEITSRKNHCLLELSRLSRAFAKTEPEPEVKSRLGKLKKALEENQRVLDLHVKASHHIADVIAGTIAAAESDGTYSSTIGRRG